MGKQNVEGQRPIVQAGTNTAGGEFDLSGKNIAIIATTVLGVFLVMYLVFLYNAHP